MRAFAGVDELSGIVRAALGGGDAIRLTGVERLRAGSKKGVYRVSVAGAGEVSGVVVYSWAEEENFWPGAGAGEQGQDAEPGPADPFAHASGLVPFLAAQRALTAIGVRAPRVLLADDSRTHYPADAAVVEDVRGGTLEAMLDADPDRAVPVLADLGRTLALMHRQRGPRYGRVDLLAQGAPILGTSCEQAVLDHALTDLAEAARRHPLIGPAEPALTARLHELRARIEPRAEYALIHGELGADHVLVDDADRAVLIDIEGLTYFDAEWEHVFLEIRFAHRYPALAALIDVPLDPARLDLYRLAIHLSLVAGPLRLLDGDFPDRPFMQRVADGAAAGALRLLP